MDFFFGFGINKEDSTFFTAFLGTLTASIPAVIALGGVWWAARKAHQAVRDQIDFQTTQDLNESKSQGEALLTEIEIRAGELQWICDQSEEPSRKGFSLLAYWDEQIFDKPCLMTLKKTTDTIARAWQLLPKVLPEQRAAISYNLKYLERALEATYSLNERLKLTNTLYKERLFISGREEATSVAAKVPDDIIYYCERIASNLKHLSSSSKTPCASVIEEEAATNC